MDIMFEEQLRKSQVEILRYRGGKMGISAVPGSGKTWTLSLLAAKIIQEEKLDDDQEVLIVTLVNSAVDHFNSRIAKFIRRGGLIPNLGYRVRTLHGLAHDIVRERPSLVGLTENFVIVDEREADSIRNEIARSWLHDHPEFKDIYLNPELESSNSEKKIWEKLSELVRDIALSFIRYAKDYQILPEQLGQRLDEFPLAMPLAEMGWEIYRDYQRALNYRGAVDFDDLIRLAVQALEIDPAFLARLQYRWPYVLEDEAQDSSRLQEKILRLLAGEKGNWVRVGDPNQAIYETFTTANPRYLKDFMEENAVSARQLPVSGRSTRSIINLANHLILWTKRKHPVKSVRDALDEPLIEPSEENDPQPNPPDDPTQIWLINRKYSPQEEIEAVSKSLERWLPEHQEYTVAVLVPRNQRGYELTTELTRRGIEFNDSLLQSTSSTRFSAGVLSDLLSYLADPQSARKLARVFEVWYLGKIQPEKKEELPKRITELIRKIHHVEDYIWPGPGFDWLEEQNNLGLISEGLEILEEFRNLVRRWQKAAILPIDQIILTISQDLLSEPDELAISHKLALLLRERSRLNPDWHLGMLTQELGLIARNERRFLGFSTDDTRFDPDQYRGKVIIGTYHKAKGLEFDRVYLMSVNNYDFPSGLDGDKYKPERWFLRNQLNLEAEALSQFEAVFSRDEYLNYQEGEATQKARMEYVRERLRLFYVGITRAKRELVITFNSGRNGEQYQSIPFAELETFWEQEGPFSA